VGEKVCCNGDTSFDSTWWPAVAVAASVVATCGRQWMKDGLATQNCRSCSQVRQNYVGFIDASCRGEEGCTGWIPRPTSVVANDGDVYEASFLFPRSVVDVPLLHLGSS
jgi:hypothetical protein